MIDRVKPLMAAWVLVFASSSFASETAGKLPRKPALGPETAGATLVIPGETDRLASLYARARGEGGKVVLWAGGDAPNQMDWLKTAFESRFPGVTLDVTVDLSKFHDLRIDQELAAGTLTPDVAMLQTTFDFDRWKARDVLLRYKPVGFARQKKGYADPDGAYVTAYNNAFVPTYASCVLELVAHFAGGVQRIGVDHHQPRAQGAEHRDGILQDIGHLHRDAVAGLEIGLFLQVGGEGGGQTIEFGVAERHAEIAEGRAVGEFLAGALEDLDHGTVGGEVETVGYAGRAFVVPEFRLHLFLSSYLSGSGPHVRGIGQLSSCVGQRKYSSCPY